MNWTKEEKVKLIKIIMGTQHLKPREKMAYIHKIKQSERKKVT